MRGLALATLFLGLCFLHPGRDDHYSAKTLADLRILIFFSALFVIGFGLCRGRPRFRAMNPVRASTGPKTATGLEQSRKARWRHGRRSAESRAAAWKRGEARAVLIALRRLLDEA